MALTTTQQQDIIKYCVGLFSAAPGGYMGSLADYVAAGNTTQTMALALAGSDAFKGLSFAYSSASTDDQFADAFLSNLLGSTVSTANLALAKTWALEQIAAYGRGQMMVNAIDAIATVDTSNADWGAARTALDAKITLATTYTITNSGTSTDISTLQSVAAGGSVSAGTTYTLTTATDSVVGTANDDSILGYVNTTTGNTSSTMTAADTIDGGSGTDTLTLTTEGANAAGSLTSATISNVEQFIIKDVNSSGASTYNFASVSGETSVVNNQSTAVVTLSNLEAGTTVGVTNGGTVKTTGTYLATATAGVLNVSNNTTGGGAVDIDGAGLTSLAITSSGGASILGAVDSTSTSITTTTITATSALTIGGLTIGTNAATQSLTISGAAADVAATSTAAAHSAVVLGALDADYASIDASGMTAGGVSATLSATTTATFTGGAGNDTVTTSANSYTGAVDAGAGTDTLVLALAAHISDTIEGANYTGFEVLQSAAAAIDMDLITGSTITAVNVTTAGSNVTDMTATQAANVTIVGTLGATTLGIKNATQVGTNDTLALTISDGDTTVAEAQVAAGDLTLAGIETVTINAIDGGTFSTMANITGLTSLTVTGSAATSFTTGAMTLGANTSFDFSGHTGTNTFNAAAATTNAFAYTGGSAVDTVTDNVIGGNIIVLGGGNDVLTLTDKTGGTATTVVTGGAGADTITANMMGNVARDAMKFIFAAGDSVSDSSTTGISATLTDTITGLDGDTLSATDGVSVEFDTEVQASSVTAGATDVVLGTTTVTNAGDFFVNIDGAATTYIYQDTDGDKIIEAGEFALALTGITQNTLATGDFTVVSGDLILITT